MFGRHYLTAVGLAAVLIVVSCAPPGPVTMQLHGQAMGTTYSVQLVADRTDFDGTPIRADIESILASIDRRYSTWRDDSDISRFNRSRSTDWQDTSAEACRLVARAVDIARRTGGSFDPTVAPLVDAWGFGRTDTVGAPPDAELDALRSRIGYRLLQTDCNKPALRKLHPELALDLSGFAKGYGADLLAGVLERRGFDRYLVEIGGELRVGGTGGDDRPWRIAIERAPDPSGKPVAVLSLSDLGLATSGNYRNVRVVDGRRYSHVIDPATGYPIEHDLAAVTVLAGSTAEADALATALLVMGPTAGEDFARRHDVAAGFQVVTGGSARFIVSPALQTRIDGGS